MPAYAAKSRYHKGGSNVGLRAWGVCRLVSVKAPPKKARALSNTPQACHAADLHRMHVDCAMLTAAASSKIPMGSALLSVSAAPEASDPCARS